jgi:hypothetical protein
MNRKVASVFIAAGAILTWTLVWIISTQALQIQSPNMPEMTSDWTQANTSGFGNQNNSWIVALEVYDGYLYAGTANQAEGGQIWRTADTITWTQVISNGFGSTYTNTNGIIFDMIEFDGQLYATVGNWWDDGVPGQIWRSSDGEVWTQVEAGGFGNNNNFAITSIGIFSDTLYATTANYVDGIEIWRSNTGNNGDWANVVVNGNGNSNNIFGTGFIEFDGYFYINTDNSVNGSEIWRTNDGLSWTPVVTGGFGDPDNDSTGGSAILDGYLYVGTRNATTGAQLYRSSNGTTWTQVVDDGFGDINNLKIESLKVFGTCIYAGTYNTTTGMEVWRYSVGTTWEQDNSDGFGNSNNVQPLWTVGTVVYNDNLYFGTNNENDGGEVWQRTPDFAIYLPLILR